MVTRLILLAIAVEALVELWKKAAPLQGFREWLVRWTPFFYSKRQGTHMLDCPYCLSVWAAAGTAAAYCYFTAAWGWFIPLTLVLHRGSNFIHLIFSYLRDRQLDLRAARRR